MGALAPCCSSDAANHETIDITRARGDKDTEPLLKTQVENDADNSTGELSRFVTPNITIKPEPLIADHIFNYPKYLSKRQELEQFVEETDEIEQISYDHNEWLVFSKNPKNFDECKILFDIIIWRLPVIEAFAKITTNYQAYIEQKLKIDKSNQNNPTYTYDALIRGIWDILTKEQCIERFGKNVFENIDYISNEKHDYLKNHDKSKKHNRFPSQLSMLGASGGSTDGTTAAVNDDNGLNRLPTMPSMQHQHSFSQLSTLHYTGNLTIDFQSQNSIIPQRDGRIDSIQLERSISNESDQTKLQVKYDELISKLNKIKSAQKGEIVIIGQRRIVRYLIRKIREMEVEHPAMKHLTRKTNLEGLPFLNITDTSSSAQEAMLERTRAASTLILHTMQVENIPPNSTEEEVFEFFKQFGKVLDVALTKEIDMLAHNNNNNNDGHRNNDKSHKKSTKSEIALDKSLGDDDDDDDVNVNVTHSEVINNVNNINKNNKEIDDPKGESTNTPPNESNNNNNNNNKGVPTRAPALVATIAFEVKSSLDKVFEATESEHGLEFHGYLLVVKQENMITIEKKRKQRRVTSERKVF